MEKKNRYCWQQFVNYIPLISGISLIGLCLLIFRMYTVPFYREQIYYIFIVVSYILGAILIWSNFYIYSKKKATYILAALMVFGGLYFNFFNKIIPTYNSVKLTFNPSFKGAFCIIGGVKGYPLLEIKDDIVYAHIPDSGVVYTSTYCNVKSFDSIKKDSSIFYGDDKFYSPCYEVDDKHNLNYSGYRIDKKEIDIYIEDKKPKYKLEGREFNGDLDFIIYLRGKYHFLDTYTRLQQLYAKGLLYCKSDSENFFEDPVILGFSIVMFIYIIGLLPLYFFWHNKKGRKAVVLFYTFIVFVFVMCVVAVLLDGLAGGMFALIASNAISIIGFILLIVSLISWIKYKRRISYQ